MRTFLDYVAEKIASSTHKWDNIKIIVPNNRAIIFLKECFKKVIERPIISPKIFTIEEFIKDLSGINPISKSEILFNFYEVYKENTPNKELESFSHFSGWASNLVEEFNEIDSQLIDSKELFNYMTAIKNLENWIPEKKRELSKIHYNLQGRVFIYYNKLYKKLLNSQNGYYGLRIREAIKNLPFYIEEEIPYHFFIGFNALTKSEAILIQEMISAQKAEILWDIDIKFFEDSYHSAGHFIRKYYKEWKVLKKNTKQEFQNFFSHKKKIEIIKTFNNNTQAKTAVKIACKLYKELPQESTVIVLGDENLLNPSLSVLPEKLPWNVTMGYPLKNTLLTVFLRLYFELHESHSQKGFPYRKFKEFSILIFVKRILKKTNSSSNLLFKKNLNYIHADDLCKNDKTGALFYTPFKNSKQFLKQIEQIIKITRNSFVAEEDEPYHIQVCDIFLGFFEKLNQYCQDYNFIKSVSDLRIVFETILSEETLNFDGDPLSGIQVMGLLETRLLDFENVVITNLNEGILPKAENSFSFFPFDVRKKFEMNTFLEQDHLYAYHFFRLLQRAKKVFLLYNASSEDFISSEPSRFLMQLEYFKEPNHKLIQKTTQLPFPELRTKNKIVEKTEKILVDLKKIGNDGFSPSSLCQYIRDPYSFYEKRILKIPETEDSSKYLSAIDKGVIVHQVLEDLYSPYLTMTMKTDYYDEMLKIIPEKLDIKFNLLTNNSDIKTGKNALIYSILEKIISKFIFSERNLVKKGLKLQILALEYDFKKTIYINSSAENQNFKGTVDRIDLVNGVLRFVDYKTGNLNSSDMTLSKWEHLTTNAKKNALFQVLSYTYFLKNDFNYDNVKAGVIPLRTFKNDFIPASIKINSREKDASEIKPSTLNNFEKELFNLILEIFDPSVPIVKKTI